MRIARFTVEHMERGCVTDNPAPRFSFALASGRQGVQLESAKLSVNGWAGETKEQVLVPYSGAKLKPFTKYAAHLAAKDNFGETAYAGTLEFFPEEGKYHLDGHRNCGVCLTPAEAAALGGVCPVCGKKLTIGVEHRVEELADRPAGFRPEGAKPFECLAPLPELETVEVDSSNTTASDSRTRVRSTIHMLIVKLAARPMMPMIAFRIPL